MFRKNYLIGFFTIALFLIGGMSAFAQDTGLVGGRIQTKGADGKMAPVEGAVVEVFRTDINQKFTPAKTDKKGKFVVAGLPLGGQYVLSISAPGTTPVIQKIKVGMDRVDIDVDPGDGKRYTEQEVRAALAASSTPQSNELTAEQKKQQEEIERKRAEIAEKNSKIESKNAIAKRALEEGVAAYESKNYDLAITKFEEGFQADPDFVDNAPIFLNAKASSLRLRAVAVYKADGSSKDRSVKDPALAKVRQDFADALEANSKAFLLIKNAPAGEISDAKKSETARLDALNGAKETLRLMSITRQIDTTKTEIAKMMIAEYIALESDVTKKAEAQRSLGAVYLAAGDSENAIIEYKKVLEINPKDADALAGIGLSLVVLGELSGDKTKFQEAADYLQRFVDVAPPDHVLLASVKDSINDLKTTQNIAPQKGNTKKKN